MLPMVGDELLPLVGLLALRRDLGCGSRRPFDRDPHRLGWSPSLHGQKDLP